mmetsp:Transcript_103810/g.293534  ORF Transcript_103810/g.293534 Transcript_103810/m.293534 type:complete len:274 (-) Transcript_103810:801-1622(-)
MAACASLASLTAILFCSLPILRTSVACFMWLVIVAAICAAAVISFAKSCTVALASVSLALRLVILSSLLAFDVLVFSSSRSHQFLWSSSSFCSAISRNIIFWIMLFTSSKGPFACAAISSAKRANARDLVLRASSRSSWMARSLGSALSRRARPGAGAAESSSVTGEGGGTGFVGAAVVTPPTLDKMSMPARKAFLSRARISDRCVHSDFFISQDCWVVPSDVESACRSALVSPRVLWSAASSVWTSPRRMFFSSFALFAACRELARAFLASS